MTTILELYKLNLIFSKPLNATDNLGYTSHLTLQKYRIMSKLLLKLHAQKLTVSAKRTFLGINICDATCRAQDCNIWKGFVMATTTSQWVRRQDNDEVPDYNWWIHNHKVTKYKMNHVSLTVLSRHVFDTCQNNKSLYMYGNKPIS